MGKHSFYNSSSFHILRTAETRLNKKGDIDMWPYRCLGTVNGISGYLSGGGQDSNGFCHWERSAELMHWQTWLVGSEEAAAAPSIGRLRSFRFPLLMWPLFKGTASVHPSIRLSVVHPSIRPSIRESVCLFIYTQVKGHKLLDFFG